MGILRTVLDDCSRWPIIAIGILYLYLNVHILKTKEIEELAYTDALTGLFNATAYRIRLNKLDEQIRNGNAEFAVVIMDINDLKIVNDRMSHQAGNQLIIAAARFISGTFANSKIYRIGGDEFVAVLEGEDYKNRKRLVGQFFKGMGMLKFSYDLKEYPLSVAVGYADYDIKKEMHYADVFKIADRNMYENKKAYKTGKGRPEKNYN